MADTEAVTQETMETSTETEGKTFTQEDVDRIVQRRLAKATAGMDDLKAKAARLDEIEEANKSELQKAQEKNEALQKKLDAIEHENAVRAIRQKIAEETGVNAAYLNGATEEECRQIAGNYLAFADANRAPVAPNVRDAGEAQPPTITPGDIMSIASERERLKAIEENIDLFK